MAMLAVIIPLLMLGVVLALGRYEELLLPQDPGQGADRYDRAVTAPPRLADDTAQLSRRGVDLGTEPFSAHP
jgi:hypothetical protein